MGTDVPTFVQKWLIFTNLGQCLSKKVGYFLIFEPCLLAGFFITCWHPSFSLILAFWVVYFLQILFERPLFAWWCAAK